jgi:hypothetical protein
MSLSGVVHHRTPCWLREPPIRIVALRIKECLSAATAIRCCGAILANSWSVIRLAAIMSQMRAHDRSLSTSPRQQSYLDRHIVVRVQGR